MGPQGTLFGRNSTGGVMNIIALNPSLTESKVFGSVGYGNFQSFTGNVYGATKLSDTAAVDPMVSGGSLLPHIQPTSPEASLEGS